MESGMEDIKKSNAATGETGRRLEHWLIGGPLVALPLLLGGARPWWWTLVAACFLLGLAAVLWKPGGTGLLHNVSRTNRLLLGLLLVYPVLQTLPLPGAALAVLSPQRLEWLAKAAAVTALPGWANSISYAPLTTAFAMLWWLFLVGYGLLLRRVLREEPESAWLLKLLMLMAVVEAFYGLLQVLIPSLGVLWEAEGDGTARGTFVNRNHYAAFLGMLWPLLLAYTLSLGQKMSRRKRNPGPARHTGDSIRAAFSIPTPGSQREQIRQQQWFWGLIIAIVLLALFFSQSRGGIVSALIALTVFVSLGGIHRKEILIFVIGCWVVMITYGSMIGFDEILARFDRLSGESMGRLKQWQETWRMIADHALTGTGLGSYATVFRVYQSHLPEAIRASHAHNDYLQLAAELGLPVALGIVVWVWTTWWKAAWRARRAAQRQVQEHAAGNSEAANGASHRLWRIGALAGAAAFLCHCWVDFNWQIPANQLYFVILLVLMK
jgi:O-antigen ligase